MRKKLCDADIDFLSLRRRQMSYLTTQRFTPANFNRNLAVAPSFVNGGNLFVLTKISQHRLADFLKFFQLKTSITTCRHAWHTSDIEQLH